MKLIAIELLIIMVATQGSFQDISRSNAISSFWSLSCGATKFESLKHVLHQFIYLSVML